MKDFRLKIKRQYEILGLVLAFPGEYQLYDFEIMFEVNDLTIKRDLQELRKMGADIHSLGKRGIHVINEMPKELLREIIPEYIGITVNRNSYDRSTNMLINGKSKNALSMIVQLQRSIELNTVIKINYYKAEDKKIEERIVEPYCLFQSEKNWRLLANHDDTIKQFLVNRIESVEPLDKKFEPISQKQIDDIFATSFKCWLGDERYTVKLKFLPEWADRIKPRQLMEFQKLSEDTDGSIIYETVVNSLGEIASWIVSRGEGVVVLEPEALKTIVISTAKGVLKNYE